jgi:4-amino-4-deoxy-L-arabinose transferase-like glycosyltransferase
MARDTPELDLATKIPCPPPPDKRKTRFLELHARAWFDSALMPDARRHRYLPYLLPALLAMAAAVAVFPFDGPLDAATRTFSHRVGLRHWIQELLALARPFGKGEVIVLIAAALGLCGSRRRAAQILVGLVVITVLVWPFKIGVGRERPRQINEHSFPSGDAATAAAFVAPLVSASPWSVPAAVAIATGVAAGRVYDGRHYPSDVLSGLAFGLLGSAVAAGLLRRWRRRPGRRWFLFAGAAVVGLDLAKLPWARALPYALDFLRIWGLPGALWMVTRRLPAFLRARRTWGPVRFPLLALLVLAFYLFLTTRSTLWDRDEPRFARATVEMVESGNYLVPTFNGALRPDKPILIYWLMSIPVRALGVSELSCRMVAPFAAVATGLMLYGLSRRRAGPEAARFAFFALTLSPLPMVSGTAATTDALLLACITGAIGAFLLSWANGFRFWHAGLLTAALTAALLTKGPVGLAVPALVMVTLLFTLRGGQVRIANYLGWLLCAAVVACGLTLAWALPANAATDGEFLRRALGHHVVQRSLEPLESHGGKSFGFYFYYIPVVLFAFFPWILYLPRVFVRPTGSPDGTTESRTVPRLVLGWSGPVLVLMSLVATKLPHYVLPAWPALALGAASGFAAARRAGRAGNRTRAARTGCALFAGIGVLLGLGLIVAPWFVPGPGLRVPAVTLGVLFLVMTAAALRGYRLGRHDAAAATLVAGMLAVLLAAGFLLLPALERHKLAPRIAERLNTCAPALPVFTCGFGEPSLTFYLGRGPVTSLSEDQLDRWAAEGSRGALVVTLDKWRRRQAALEAGGTRELGRFEGFNYSNGRWVTLLILAREGVP